ncbi:unnamed protein product [Taenia asiatica]|uniref:Uncharacterized protein n=1 Tax=Taenia asiatica TaxID=60517 RepID=A0A0R3W109_TAEAS|nr:unnamed protein product [Taenia asiatica]
MDSFNALDSETQRNEQNLGSIGQQNSFDSTYADTDNDHFSEIIQPMDNYDYVSCGVPLGNSMGLPVSTGTNRMGSRFFNPMEFQNGNNFLMRQPLQPFLLQQILQQQQLAKCVYSTDSALQLLNLRNSTVGLLPGYQQAQVHPFLYPHLTNSNAVNYSICNHLSQHHQQQPTMKAAIQTNGTGEGDLSNPTTSDPESTSRAVENKYGEGFPLTTQELEC